MTRTVKAKAKLATKKASPLKIRPNPGRRKNSPSSPVHLRLALAQINPIVGDFKHNENRIRECLREAVRQQADIVLFPELAITGYPPEDLLLKRGFVNENLRTLHRLIPDAKGITTIVGYVESGLAGLYNSAALISNGKLLGSYRKMRLPNYGVFDEKRYFVEGNLLLRFFLKGVCFGITVCEDIWSADGPGKLLSREGQADVILNISSSPYHCGKGKDREEMIRQRARQYRAHIVYDNLVGGQDEIIFDGHSLVVGPNGALIARGNSFTEEMVFADIEVRPKSGFGKTGKKAPASIKTLRIAAKSGATGPKSLLPHPEIRELEEIEEIFRALVMGTRDYIRKNGFTKVVIGLSGGIDSALTAAIAAEALGPENVIGVLMPSPYSSKESVGDSLELVRCLSIRVFKLPIAEAMHAYKNILADVFQGKAADTTEENLQARIRGNLLMALSNKMGWLVLTTGNKSEISVGYCTLYGDMAGGFSVLKDVPKTLVYRLCEWLNRDRCIIPENIIHKEPSAELRPNQKDTDSLPPYELLDPVLHRYVEEDCGMEELKNMGLSAEEIRRVTRMVDVNEYKRRQGSPGIKITPKAFGKDRRLPITNHYEP